MAMFETHWLSGGGPTCRRFEERFEGVAGTQHALAMSNCGSALHPASHVLGAVPGDEVIVADYTFPATGHSVPWTGRPSASDAMAGCGQHVPIIGPRLPRAGPHGPAPAIHAAYSREASAADR